MRLYCSRINMKLRIRILVIHCIMNTLMHWCINTKNKSINWTRYSNNEYNVDPPHSFVHSETIFQHNNHHLRRCQKPLITRNVNLKNRHPPTHKAHEVTTLKIEIVKLAFSWSYSNSYTIFHLGKLFWSCSKTNRFMRYSYIT